MEEAIRKADVLIEALPYIKSFRDRTVVIKLGGSALTEMRVLRDVLEDVVFMRTVGIRPILVHGGGPHISEEMARRGKSPQFIQGHRMTDDETLDIVVDVLVNKVNEVILRELQTLGDGGVSMWRKGHPPLRARKYLPRDTNGNPIDLGRVGELFWIETKVFSKACKEGKIPVVPPLARGPRGILNINADSVAAFLAGSLRSEKLVFLSNTHGIMLDPTDVRSTASTLSKAEVESLIERKVITGGMLPKVKASIMALEAGVKKAHIIDGRLPHSLLLEIFTDKGVGTQIVL